MISCPPEQELLELVDGELSPDRADDLVTHLAECADCRVLLGSAEAALRYATGGLADSGRWGAARAIRQAPSARRWIAAAVLLLAAGLLASSAFVPLGRPLPPTRSTASSPAEDDALRTLTARVERLRVRVARPAISERELLAAGALAAAETRGVTAGADARRARLADVMERFVGTPAAREARAILAAGDVR